MNERLEQKPLEVLIFEIAGQRYGLPSSDVQELLRVVALTPLPNAPAIVEGVMNLRGRVIPVFDIRKRFRLPPKPAEASDHLIVARAGDLLGALRVDRAVELARVEAVDIQNAEAVLPGVEYVAKVAKLPEGLVLIHDLRTFLTKDESCALGELLPALPAPAEQGGAS